ncbi:MAG: nucleotidyltransferase domain-containing protein [Vulcanimicrobiaceae bacterium]
MATTRPYPQWWHRRARERRLALDATVAAVCAACALDAGIVRVLAFGSYARQEVAPTSDLDLIVIAESSLPQGERTAQLYMRLPPGVPIDAIVYTPEEFERLRATRSFVAQAVAEGRWIYARASA